MSPTNQTEVKTVLLVIGKALILHNLRAAVHFPSWSFDSSSLLLLFLQQWRQRLRPWFRSWG